MNKIMVNEIIVNEIMSIGIIGLGRMGNAIACRLVLAGHQVMGFDPNPEAQEAAALQGILVCSTLTELAERTQIIWLMLPEGAITEKAFQELLTLLPAGAIIIDGGNSYYEDSIKRAHVALDKNILFLDCGTSGGIRGREVGFCLMVGGDTKAFETVYPLLVAIAAPDGVSLVGPSGAGHYVKMVHNGIEYALLQAYAEGFHILKEGHFKQEHLNVAEISRLWNDGSIIRSFILELAHDIFKEDQELDTISGEVAESGMGLWTVQEADKHDISALLIDDALKIRAESRKTGGNYATKVVALLRNKFGGHAYKKINSSKQ